MSRFNMGDLPDWKASPAEIDSDKKYDIYCHLYGRTIIVYKNAKFRGSRYLPGEGDRALGISAYIVIEQEDGTELFLSSMNVCMFCEHGVNPGFSEVKRVDQ